MISGKSVLYALSSRSKHMCIEYASVKQVKKEVVRHLLTVLSNRNPSLMGETLHQLLESSETSSLKNLAREMREGIGVFVSLVAHTSSNKQTNKAIVVYVAAVQYCVHI